MRYKAEQSQSHVNLEHAGHMRNHVERDHREERRALPLVKSVNRQLNSINVMTARSEESRFETATSKPVDDVSNQRDSSSAGKDSRDHSQKRHDRDQDQDTASYCRQR